MFGARDVTVPVRLSIERLKPLIAQGKPFQYRLFPNASHNLDERQALPVMMKWFQLMVPSARH